MIPFAIANRALAIDKKIGVEERHMLDVVARDQFGKFVDDTIDVIGVKAALVEHHVGAVVALVRAAHAAGVGQLPHADRHGINAWVGEMISGRRKRIDVGNRPFWFVNDFSVVILE